MRDRKPHIGKCIRSIRRALGLKQSAFAGDIGFAPTTLCSIENGKALPSENFLERFCASMNIDRRQFIEFAERHFKKPGEPLETQKKTIWFINNQRKEGPYVQ